MTDFTKLKKCIASLGTALLLFTGLFSIQAFAAEQSAQDANRAAVSFEVRLEMNGDIPDEDVPFTFLLDAVDGAPLPSTSHVTISGEGTAQFDEIVFTKPGTYIYTVSQRDDGLANYVYDSKVYTVGVTVRYGNNERLVATYSVATAYHVSDDMEIEAKEPEILFINEYNEPDDPEPVTPDTSEPTTTTQPSEDLETTTTTGSSEESQPAETTAPSETPTTTTVADSFMGTPLTGEQVSMLAWIVLLGAAIIVMISCARRQSSAEHRDK
jgi:pilin isopeptide linkage protein